MKKLYESFSKFKDTVVIIMIILLLSKFLGLLKTRIFAQLFGASTELDLFWASFTIPDLLFNVIIAGSINAAIIPIFSNTYHDKGRKNLNSVFRSVSLVYLTILIVLSLVLLFASTPIAENIISSSLLNSILGITKQVDVEKVEMLSSLIKIMMLSPIILAFSNFLTAYLQTNKRFFYTSLAPLLYNFGTVVLSLILVQKFNFGIYGLAWSVVAGSALHFLIQLPEFIKYYRKKDESNIEYEGVNFKEVFKVVKLAIPRILGFLGEHINQIYNTMLSFTLSGAGGALSAYRFATNLYLFPVHIIVTSISQVVLPDLSESFTKKDSRRFLSKFNNALQQMLIMLLPITAIMLILRLPIVRITLGVGEFTWWDTVITSWCLALLSISIIPQAVATIIFRAFFAMQETWLPLIATIVTIAVNVVLAYYLTNFFSHYFDWRPILTQVVTQVEYSSNQETFNVISSFITDSFRWSMTRGDSDAAIGGIALAYSIAFTVEALVLSFLLNFKVKVLTFRDTVKPFMIKLLNTILMTISMYFVYKSLDFYLDTSKTIYLIIVTTITLVYGGSLYLIGSYLFKIKEIDIVINKAKGLYLVLYTAIKSAIPNYAIKKKN